MRQIPSDLYESAWQRSAKDSQRFRDGIPFFLLWDAILAVLVGLAASDYLVPNNPTNLEKFGIPLAVTVGSALLLLIAIRAVCFFFAPTRQRNEARKWIETQVGRPSLISVTPISDSGIQVMGGGNTIFAIGAYLDVSTLDRDQPLRNCRVKLFESKAK